MLQAGPPRRKVDVLHRLAYVFAQGAGTLSRWAGLGSGSVLPGRVALAMDTKALARLASGRELVLVSGTNGKTTTTRMITAALGVRAPVVTNAAGSNLESGLVTALLDRPSRALAVLEVDEVVLPRALEAGRPAAVVLLNLSRDQLDRTFEVSAHARRWADGLANSSALVVANADDPLVVSAVRSARPHEQDVVWVAAGQTWRADVPLCPTCGAWWEHETTPWACSRCGTRRPVTSWQVEGDSLVGPDGQHLPLGLQLPGAANAGNAAMALATAVALGVSAPEGLAPLRLIQEVTGRYLTVSRDGRSLRLLLAKNPAGWMTALQEVRQHDRALLLAVNARSADGTDPSWLWDVGFESLAGRPVVATGERAQDLSVRLHYAGVEHRTRADLTEALDVLPLGEVDVLANYTAFTQLRALLTGRRR